MRPSRLARRGLTHYWRTNVAVVLGVATAVAVLSGALLVGDSVRGSLKDLVLQRIGRTDLVVASASFFRGQLADALRTHPSFGATFSDVAPLVAAQGLVTEQEGRRRAGQVRVYGVDDRFWQFHGVAGIAGPLDRDALVSPALARDIDARAGSTVLVRVQRPSEIPLESLHGRKDDLGSTLRLTVRAVVPSSSLGEFSLEAQQGDVRAVFVPLSLLQETLDLGDRVNTLLVSALPEGSAGAPRALGAPSEVVATGERVEADTLAQIVRSEARLEDIGLTMKTLDDRRAIVIGSDGGLLNDTRRAVHEALADAGERQPSQPVLPISRTLAPRRSLAFRIRSSLRSIWYHRAYLPRPDVTTTSPIVLNDWAVRSAAVIYIPSQMEYYVRRSRKARHRTAEFSVAAVVPIAAGDRDPAPAFWHQRLTIARRLNSLFGRFRSHPPCRRGALNDYRRPEGVRAARCRPASLAVAVHGADALRDASEDDPSRMFCSN